MVVEDAERRGGDDGEEDGEGFQPEDAWAGERWEGAVGAAGEEGARGGGGGGDEVATVMAEGVGYGEREARAEGEARRWHCVDDGCGYGMGSLEE